MRPDAGERTRTLWSDDATITTTSCGRRNIRIPQILELANNLDRFGQPMWIRGWRRRPMQSGRARGRPSAERWRVGRGGSSLSRWEAHTGGRGIGLASG